MFKAIVCLLLVVGISSASNSSRSAASAGTVSASLRSVQCNPLTGVDLTEFLRVSKMVAAAPYLAELRAELAVSSWPEDSVQLVSDAALCDRLDSLVVAWLAGPGAGTLAGVVGTIGEVTVARIGPTIFHVRPGSSVPVQPIPHYPYFVVDTAAPTRVAYWGQSGG